jgi:hypothetical protein
MTRFAIAAIMLGLVGSAVANPYYTHPAVRGEYETVQDLQGQRETTERVSRDERQHAVRVTFASGIGIAAVCFAVWHFRRRRAKA